MSLAQNTTNPLQQELRELIFAGKWQNYDKFVAKFGYFMPPEPSGTAQNAMEAALAAALLGRAKLTWEGHESEWSSANALLHAIRTNNAKEVAKQMASIWRNKRSRCASRVQTALGARVHDIKMMKQKEIFEEILNEDELDKARLAGALEHKIIIKDMIEKKQIKLKKNKEKHNQIYHPTLSRQLFQISYSSKHMLPYATHSA